LFNRLSIATHVYIANNNSCATGRKRPCPQRRRAASSSAGRRHVTAAQREVTASAGSGQQGAMSKSGPSKSVWACQKNSQTHGFPDAQRCRQTTLMTTDRQRQTLLCQLLVMVSGCLPYICWFSLSLTTVQHNPRPVTLDDLEMAVAKRGPLSHSRTSCL
jgi:hypothetical protein